MARVTAAEGLPRDTLDVDGRWKFEEVLGGAEGPQATLPPDIMTTDGYRGGNAFRSLTPLLAPRLLLLVVFFYRSRATIFDQPSYFWLCHLTLISLSQI